MTASPALAVSSNLSGSLAQAIVNALQKPIIVLDGDLRISFANRSFCEWVKSPWEEIDHEPVERFLGNPLILDRIREAKIGSTMLDLHGEFEVLGLGSREVLLRIHPLGSADPKTVFIGVVDVTDGRETKATLTQRTEAAQRAEAALREQNQLLQHILDSSPDGIFVVDALRNHVLSNPACEKILGTDPAALKHLKEGRWPDDFGAFLNDQVTHYPVEDLPLSRALEGESCDDVELWIKSRGHKDGKWISVTSRPLRGGKDGAVATFRDVTLAKSLRERLADQAEEVTRSNRELEQFAYVAAHDLQEPLRMVSSYVQLLSKRYKGKLDSEADEFIGFATDGAKRMSLLINDLLTYSRVGCGDAIEDAVDCEKVLEQVIYNLGEKSRSAGVEITHGPLPKIIANELQITQVFQNLLDNAIKFRNKDRPKVHISAYKDPDKWTFSVSDNGIGIDDNSKERIFVIFQRLNAREDYDGTGIGLSVCKKIVEKHRGNIWAESNAAQGTTMSFTWP